MSNLKSIAVTYSAMSRAIQTNAVPAIARAFHDAGQLTDVRRRNLWDGAIRRNRPKEELCWLCGPEAKAMGFSLQDNCVITRHNPHHVSPLGVAVWLRKPTAIRVLLDAGAPRSPMPNELNFLTQLMESIPAKVVPAPRLLALLRDANVALDVPGHGSPLIATIKRSCHQSAVRKWLEALEPLGLNWHTTDHRSGNNLLHELAESHMSAEDTQYVLSRVGATLDMFDVRNAAGLTPLELAAQKNGAQAAQRQQVLAGAHGELLAEQRQHDAQDRAPIVRTRATRWRA